MSVEVLIAVLASVCVMLLTRTLPAPTPELTLAGVVLGAAIPVAADNLIRAGDRAAETCTEAVMILGG